MENRTIRSSADSPQVSRLRFIKFDTSARYPKLDIQLQNPALMLGDLHEKETSQQFVFTDFLPSLKKVRAIRRK